MLIQHLEDVIQGCVLTLTPGQVSQEPLQWQEDVWQEMLVILTWAAENSYTPPPWVVRYIIFGFYVLEDQQVDLHPKIPSWPHWSVTFSGHFHHGWLLGSLLSSPVRTPTPRRWWATRRASRKSWSSLSSTPSTTLTSMLTMIFFHSSLQLPMSPFLASTSGASSSRPHIHSSMLYAAAGAQVVFVIPWGILAPLTLVFFSTTASTIAWQPSCMVFRVTSIWAILSAQLTVPVKLNLTSLTFPKGSPSLNDHYPKNKIASPGAMITVSAIHSLRPSWNMSAINQPLQAWEGGGWSPTPPSWSLWYGHNSMIDLCVGVNLSTLSQQRLLGWQSAGLHESEGHLGRSTHMW